MARPLSASDRFRPYKWRTRKSTNSANSTNTKQALSELLLRHKSSLVRKPHRRAVHLKAITLGGAGILQMVARQQSPPSHLLVLKLWQLCNNHPCFQSPISCLRPLSECRFQSLTLHSLELLLLFCQNSA